MISVHTACERPDLWDRGIDSRSVWPEYNLHGDVLNQWWRLLDEELPEFQFVLYDERDDVVVAEGHTGPFAWDGVDQTLPDGIDRAIELIFQQSRSRQPVNTLCALAAETPGRDAAADLRSRSWRRCARSRNVMGWLIWSAPVRPSWKDRYPVTSIERLRPMAA